MTNFEHYAEQIKAVECDFAFKKDGEIAYCGSISCNKCEFYGRDSCTQAKIEWLYSEHIEQPKLTQNERKLCEILNGGYIARNLDGELFAFNNKPCKIEYPCWLASEAATLIKAYTFTDCNFNFIKWEDDEPRSVEELLKLEVME